MFETSKDILNIVIAISVAGVAFFLCWLMFYAVGSIRQVYKIAKEARRGVEKIGELIDVVKDKVDKSAANLVFLGEGLKKVVEVAKDYKSKKYKNKSETTTSKKRTAKKKK